MDIAAHCAAIVRAGNRDRYVADLLAPDDRRNDLMALHAFDIEVSTIRAKVTEPTLGEIRLEWWRQALRGDHGGHPVASTLAETIARYRLPIAAFDNLLQARVFDLYDDPMPSIGDLEGYAGDTASAVIQLGALILAGGDDPGSAEAAGFAGVALTIVDIIAHLPQTVARGQCLLPADALAREGIKPEELRAGETPVGVRSVAGELVTRATDRFAEAQDAARALDPTVLPAFLPATVVPLYLKRFGNPNRDPLRDDVTISPLRRQWAIWRASRRGNF
ncbi:phytoene/squalene synthase family protein [Bauldia sp.]|uniref:phytoene/squalene synthase family protein n=1 Tax=Bauldia sp. TaxID=2575872 RepID=UPI003BACA81B